MATDSVPTIEQINELRKLFLDKLCSEGAPSSCVGEFESYRFLFINNSKSHCGRSTKYKENYILVYIEEER